jgi:4-hydroxy-tetrahydrodipicolinate synthase
MTTHPCPAGVWPVMLTPFRVDRSIDWGGVDALVEFYLAAGVAGLFAVAQSAEMFALSPAERIALARHVVDRVAGRVPVVAAGAFGSDRLQQVDLVQQLAATGVQAVVLLSNQFADDGESEDLWRERASLLLAATPGIDLGLYECPSPYKRILTAATLGWAAASGRFVFHKDTCLSERQIVAKLAAIRGSRLRLFNAEAESLLVSLRAGGAGFSGIAANAYPEAFVWLCAHVDDPAADAVQDVLTVTERVIDAKYPASAKRFLRRERGVAIEEICRVASFGFSEHDDRGIAAVRRLTRGLVGGVG